MHISAFIYYKLNFEVRGTFLDISKAFIKVWYKGLTFKLKQNGVTGDLLKSFLKTF